MNTTTEPFDVYELAEARHDLRESKVWPHVKGLPYCLKVHRGPGDDVRPHVVFEVDYDETTALKVLSLLKENSCTE